MFKNNQGFTLIEILITLLIVSIGLLGVATLQVRGQQITFGTYYRSQATFLADDIMDRMQVNFSQASTGLYALDSLSNCPNSGALSNDCDENSCNPIALTQYDLSNWCNLLQNTLPAAEAIITWDSGVRKEYTIKICWADILNSNETGCGIDGKEEQVWHHISPQM